ncbi:glycosyltransferase family 4 protein [Hypholoma sublateritium FD-334 SS-4]|uniref:Glycosyltransferase family 4 protein n=1 Tax=Hypholoma sublateritium (strain FD-334 SS-4) TaxID=945553 RepID=A0A0D2N524_HYPSF|nr:glycosyltransferase family 4 protein [Hypholoma sublateritium FD-334 SS-4]
MHTLSGKKLLLFTESYGDINGVSRTTGKIIEYLRSHGVHVVIVAPVSPFHPASTHDQIRVSGYPLPMNPELSVAYPLRLDNIVSKASRRWKALSPFRSVDGDAIRHAIEQEQPDFIYLASPASLGFQILLQLRLLSYFAPQVPVLANFQTDLSTFAELMFTQPVSSLSVWVLRTVQGYLFSHPTVKKVFYPSARVKDYLIRANVQEDKLKLLQRGVDTDLFHPSRSDPAYKASLAGKSGTLVLLSVCRLSPEKGFDFLANVAHALHRAHFPFHLHIVGGNNSPAVVDSIKALFAALPSDVVTFSGLLQGTKLARAYASADVFLHSSISETFGLVVLEAMASGLPVIARDQGGPSGIIAHGESGFLVPPTALDAFVARVIEFGPGGALAGAGAEAMGRTGRRMAERATWDKIGSEVAMELARSLPAAEEGMDVAPPARPRDATFVVMMSSMAVISLIWFGTALVYIFSEVPAAVQKVWGKKWIAAWPHREALESLKTSLNGQRHSQLLSGTDCISDIRP